MLYGGSCAVVTVAVWRAAQARRAAVRFERRSGGGPALRERGRRSPAELGSAPPAARPCPGLSVRAAADGSVAGRGRAGEARERLRRRPVSGADPAG